MVVAMAGDDVRQTEEGNDPDSDPPRTSMEEHEATYNTFLRFTKWGVAVVVLVLIGMAVFLL
jgi:hypothetical protein